jgi:sensor domain CHASE-containing protein
LSSGHLLTLKNILLEKDFSCATVLRSRTALVFLLVAAVALGFGMVQVVVWEDEFLKADRAEARRAATPYAEGIKVQLVKSVAAAYTISSMVSTSSDLRNGVITSFDQIATLLQQTYGGITNLQLAPCGIVSQISPLAGNEAAIGHNLLQDPARVTAAVATIEARKLTFVGPLNLIQGGVAVIGRYPVFNNLTSNNCSFPVSGIPSAFWGYATMLTKIDDLLSEQRLSGLTGAGYDYAITAPSWGVVSGSAIPADAETVEIPFSDGTQFQFATWTLHVAPADGWATSSQTLPWKVASLALAAISSLITSYTLLFRNMVLGKAIQFIDNEATSSTSEIDA